MKPKQEIIPSAAQEVTTNVRSVSYIKAVCGLCTVLKMVNSYLNQRKDQILAFLKENDPINETVGQIWYAQKIIL